MDYFRQSLLTYSTDRQISTLLHIHVETDKPKVLIPPCKAKNYVDQLLSQYTVKMYSYPQLNAADSKLAFNLFQLKKMNANIFQLEEIKRKPMKKKLSKKSIPNIPITPSIQKQEYKSCPCCGAKVANKHKCEHTYCQKPCTRIKKGKLSLAISPEHSPLTWNRKKRTTQEEDFTPEREELEPESSKSSDQDNYSDYEQEEQMVTPEDEELSEEFSSNLTKGKVNKKKKSKRVTKKQIMKNKKNSKNKSQPKRVYKKLLRVSETENQVNTNQQNEKPNINEENLENFEQSELSKKNSQNNIYEISTSRKTKAAKKKTSKKKIQEQQSNQQSEFEPNSSLKKDSKKKKSYSGKAENMSPEDKQSELGSAEAYKPKKQLNITKFCGLNELRINTRFNVKIIGDSQVQNQQQFNKQIALEERNQPSYDPIIVLKSMQSDLNSQKQALNLSFGQGKAEIDNLQDRNQQKNRNQQLEVENNQNIIRQDSNQEEPAIDATIDPIFNPDQAEGQLFEDLDNDKNL